MSKATYQSKLMEKLDGFVEQGTSDQLFAAEYLHSHVTFATAKCENIGKIYPHDIKFQVVHSLRDALVANELTPYKQELVLSMWDAINKH
ncbi:YfcL family protein [Moritella sp.]|uniref:YfcL family protein n=1 Tax=Moritella sp. TaxID=78556 RepID=UPI001D8EC9C1|nr:YfcL family protein [Moritella sp.]MCJ8348522.1 YfcL family protein [Moritella sp.]NQZ39038.1 YfcL family protein [Moritella sp.]